MVSASAFAHLERGLSQRLLALGLFLDDVYGDQRIFADKPLLRDLALGAKSYLPRLAGVAPPGGVRVHVAGIDLSATTMGPSVFSKTTCAPPRGCRTSLRIA